MYTIDKIDKEKKLVAIIGKIISIILYIIIIPIIIFNFVIIIETIINPGVTPEIFGYKNFIIVSGSMEPTIMTGDAIFVKKVPENELKENDIISFHDGNIITTHRIVEITEKNGIKEYTTKGDNNNTEDKNKVTYDEIEGKYQFKITGFGIIMEILQSKITLIILIVIIIINSWYTSRINNRKKERKEKRREHDLERKD